MYKINLTYMSNFSDYFNFLLEIFLILLMMRLIYSLPVYAICIIEFYMINHDVKSKHC